MSEENRYELFITSRKLDMFLDYYAALIKLYANDVDPVLEKRAMICLERYATSVGTYDGLNHVGYYDDSGKLILGLVYNPESGQVKKTELPKKNGIREIVPKQFPTKFLYVKFGRKKRNTP